MTGLLVLLSAAVPPLESIRAQWLLAGSVSMLRGSLHWARLHAVAANRSLALEIGADGSTFRWRESPSGRDYDSTARALPGSVRIVAAPRRPLRFHPRGNAAPAGSYTLEGQAGRARVIVNFSGRIRVSFTPTRR